MLNEATDLAHVFPEFKEAIHTLKMSDAHFARLFKEYDAIVHELHRIESQIETPSDSYIEQLKKKHLKVKDELYALLKQAAEVS